MSSPQNPEAPHGAASSDGPAAGRRRWGLYEWLYLVGGLWVAAMATTQVYDVLRRQEIVLDAAQRNFASISRSVADQTAHSLSGIDAVLRDVVSGRELTNAIAADRMLLLRPRGFPQLRELVVLDADGKIIAQTASDSLLGTLAEHIALSANGNLSEAEPLISQVEREAGSGEHVVAIIRRGDQSAHFRGKAIAFVDLSGLRRAYDAVDVGPGSVVRLLRRDGVELVRSPSTAASSPKQAGTATPPGDSHDFLTATQPVSGFPLLVDVSVERAAVMRPWKVQAMHSATRTTLLCASVMLLMWLVLRQLRKREQAEGRLRVQTALLDELFESAPEAIVMLDLDQRVTRVNREFTRLFGYSYAQAQGRLHDELIVPEDLAQDARDIAHAVGLGQHTSGETERVRADGTRVQVSVLGAPILTATGQIASYAIYRDITERKLADAERDKLQSRLRQSEKLEAIGSMAGGIAHDFNNILGAILGYGDMALTAAPEGGAIKRYVGNVMNAAARAKSLVDQILNYSRSTRAKSGVVAVTAVVDETLDLVRASLPADIELRTRFEANKVTVIGDPTQIHQLVMNLCTNAIQAMTTGGVLTVALDTFDTPHDRELSHSLLPAGRYVRLGVQDSGCGMEPAVLERIFEPFFTTRAIGSGTGLGLALVQGIVAELGGAIAVGSQPGAGSTFDLYLPRSDVPSLEKPEAKGPLPRGGGERVLVVEDERALMLLAEEMLAALGYEPAGFTRAGEALAEFRAAPQRFDAVVIDHLMPSMTGTEFARLVRESHADIPIVLVSGYIGPLLEQEARAAGIDHILTKPLDFRQLADAMSQVLAHQAV